MASVVTLTGPDNKPRGYRVRYLVEGLSRSKTFARKRDADRFVAELASAKYSGIFVDPAGARTTVRQYSEIWRAAQVHRPTTARRVAVMLDVHLNPALGDRVLPSVRHSDMQAFVKGRVAVMAPATLRSTWSYVRSMFKAAVADRLIAFSPCETVRLDLPPAEQIVVPTLNEILAITDELPERWAALGLLGAQTGMRPGELLGLCVGQVDFLRRTITVDRQLRDGAIVMEPKTHKSRRVIPVDDVTVNLLAAHLERWPASPDGLVFRKVDGVRPLSERETRKSWSTAVRRAGIARRVRLHDMRHFYASTLIAAGAQIVAVQARLGHKRAAETTDTYGHLFPAEEDRTRGMIGDVFGVARVINVSRGE